MPVRSANRTDLSRGELGPRHLSTFLKNRNRFLDPFDFAQGKTFARNDKAHERLPTRGGHCRVARFAGKISSAGSMAASRRTVTEIDATAWAKGASARSGSDGGVGKNRGR